MHQHALLAALERDDRQVGRKAPQGAQSFLRRLAGHQRVNVLLAGQEQVDGVEQPHHGRVIELGEITIVGIYRDDLRAVGAQAADEVDLQLPAQRRQIGEIDKIGRRRAELEPILGLAAKNKDSAAVFFVETPVPQGAVQRPAAGKIDAIANRLTRIFRPDWRDHSRPLSPQSGAEGGIDRIAARHAPHCRAVFENKIVNADIAENAISGMAHTAIPERIEVNSITSALW